MTPEGRPNRVITYDMGICHLLEDSRDGGDLVLIGRSIFRKDEKRPLIDEITVPTRARWRDQRGGTSVPAPARRGLGHGRPAVLAFYAAVAAGDFW